MCRHVWQPNFVDTDSFKAGHKWYCFICGKTKKKAK